MNGSGTVVYTYSEMLLGLIKEGNPAICNLMDEPGKHYVKQNQPITEEQKLYDSNYVSSLKQSTHRTREHNGGCQGERGGGKWGVLVNGHKSS